MDNSRQGDWGELPGPWPGHPMMNAGKRSRRWIMEDFKNGTIRNGTGGRRVNWGDRWGT